MAYFCNPAKLQKNEYKQHRSSKSSLLCSCKNSWLFKFADTRVVTEKKKVPDKETTPAVGLDPQMVCSFVIATA